MGRKSSIVSTSHAIQSDIKELHYVKRGDIIVTDAVETDDIVGFEADRMKARALLTAEQEKKLLRRVDWHIMPLCAVLFLLKNLDYQNVANAKIMNKGTPFNMLTQLGMTTNDYNFIATIYYIPYIVAEAPSNLFVKRMRPSVWLSRIVASWGLVLACHAAVTNKEGMYAARFFLGLMEAGMFPCVILQLCYWYRPDEMSRRLLYFYVLGNFSTVISGVLAYAFDGASGAGNLSGWQWLFLVEGVFTVLFGIAIFFLLPDFPTQAKWLTKDEKAFIEARLPGNAPQAKEANFNFREIISSLKDVKTWLFTACWAFYTVGTTGLTFYQPTVVADLGFTSIQKSQLLNIPPSFLAGIIIAVLGLWADSARLPRPLFPLFIMVVLLGMYAILYTYPSTGAVYAACILASSFSAAFYPLMWPWRVQTTSKATGSAFTIGFVNSYGQIGGAVGSQIFQSKYGPRYGTSFAVAMVMIACAMGANLVTWWYTYDIERDTRMLKLARIEATKRGETVLDDVDISREKHKEASISSQEEEHRAT